MSFTKILKKRFRFLLFVLLVAVLVITDHATKFFFHQTTIFSTKEFKHQIKKDTIYLIPKQNNKDIKSTKITLKENEILGKRYLFPEKETFYIKQIVVIPNFWSLTYVRNHNIGFSLLQILDQFVSPSTKIKILIAVQLSAILFIFFYFVFRFKMKYIWSFAFIFSGGVGNVSERMIRGYVVDFIRWEFPYLPFDIFNPWPIFNVADIWVSIGGVLLLWAFFHESKISAVLTIDDFYEQNNEQDTFPIYFR